MAKVKPRVINMYNETPSNVVNTTSTNINWPYLNDPSYTYTTPYCEHRLPCGYCKLLNKDCPQKTYTVTYRNGTNPIYTTDGPTCGTTKTTNI